MIEIMAVIKLLTIALINNTRRNAIILLALRSLNEISVYLFLLRRKVNNFFIESKLFLHEQHLVESSSHDRGYFVSF